MQRLTGSPSVDIQAPVDTHGAVDARIGHLREVTCTVNGALRTAAVEDDESAIEMIRNQLGITGPKLACGGGVCGACTVLLDETPIASCLTPATALEHRSVVTVEGLSSPNLHPVQRAFMAHDALQCGYCTPGFVVSSVAFVNRWRSTNVGEPTRHEIADALAGHLCRCGAYEGIYRAVRAACRGDFDDSVTDHSILSPRHEALAKVTGAALFTTDIQLPGQLEAVLVRSHVAHATINHLDVNRAKTVPGLRALIELLPDDRTVRWAGQPLAAVAATDLQSAQMAARFVSIDMVELPAIISPSEARNPNAGIVHGGRAGRKAAPSSAENPLFPAGWKGNIRGPGRVALRPFAVGSRVKRARNRNDPLLFEQTFGTAVQVHTPLEPHACVADWSDPSKLELWVSTQAVDHLSHAVSEKFGLARDRVIVHADHVGGAFGSKLALTTEVIAACELSRVALAPVRLVYSRGEELTGGGLRPGTQSHVSMLADSSGRLRALSIDTYGDGGVSIGNTTAGLAGFMYGTTPRRLRDYDVVTNAPPGTPFRGPGGPPLAWALEQSVDAVAESLDESPIALRKRWDKNARRQELYDWADALPVWQQRETSGSATGRFRTGVGIAAANWIYVVDPNVEVEVAVRNGRLTASCAVQDMGTGSRTVLARAVAQEFGIAESEVVVLIGRSDLSHGPASGGSRTTTSLYPTAREAAAKLRAQITGELSANEGMSATAKRKKDSKRRLVPFTIRNMQIGRGFSGAVHVTHVECDTHTGKTRVLQVWGGIAVGKIVIPTLARSQCEGAIIQGIGYALYEERRLDPNTGHVLSANLEDYRIPQLGDTPEITIHFHESGWDHVPGGAVGLGEIATIGVAASVGNAIHNATGWRPTELPVRPDRLLDGMGAV
jgi:xanthine dehydrogenase YagR molybdenum-binding subunit